MLKEKAILFSTEMVQAILDGQKTQTRRMVQPQEALSKGWIDPPKCPYGQAGNYLWVRESWRPISWSNMADEWIIEYKTRHTLQVKNLYPDSLEKDDDTHLKLIDILLKKCEPEYNDDEETFSWTSDEIEEHMPWKPSIHMPKSTARIWLKIKEIRVERLLDISEEDAFAEGVKYWVDEGNDPYLDGLFKDYETGKPGLASPYSSFLSLWDKIHGHSESPEDPYVWVVTFEVISTIGKPNSENVEWLKQVNA